MSNNQIPMSYEGKDVTLAGIDHYSKDTSRYHVRLRSEDMTPDILLKTYGTLQIADAVIGVSVTGIAPMFGTHEVPEYYLIHMKEAN